MLALYAWPAISAVILRNIRNLQLAILVVIITGYLFLPVKFAIDFPMVPPMGKHVIPVLTIALLILLMRSRVEAAQHQPGYVPRNLLAKALIVLLLLGALGTAWTNGDRIVTPLEIKQGLRLYDGFSMAIASALLILPVLVGRKFFAHPDTHRLILIVLCVAACVYAFFALYEVRMSPHLNRTIYGFTPHSWRQHVRSSGFRPMVFMEHGLRVSLFFALALIAAVGLFRMGWRTGFMGFAIGLLALTLVLTKSLGALMIALLVIPMVFFSSIRILILAAALIAFTVLTYPVLRGGGYVPVDRIVAFANSVDPQRAGSFITRLENEDIMLERALERPLFGWGGYGRSRVRNEKGIDITIADGHWTIIIGLGGWVRYIGEFGLMTAPMLFLFLNRRRMEVGRETAVLSIILAANMVDLIPNSGQTPITWLITGALWGRLEMGARVGATGPTAPEPGPRHARDFGTITPRRQRPQAGGVGSGPIKPPQRRPQAGRRRTGLGRSS